ncbi:MAG: hydroxyacylglutathione hydrolase [Sedimentisphaerales bacterium]|nr:hydroxyacylglutathione hydrolase [Sedimentisphaerales bacterium]
MDDGNELQTKRVHPALNIIMQNDIQIIPAMGDNFIYLCRYEDNNVFVVDPGQADCVESQLENQELELTHILVTHHHFDHIGGVAPLKKKYGCQVIGAYSGVDKIAKDGDLINLGDWQVKVISTPGHTKTSVCYYIKDKDNNGAVFTGDTLFVGGCGRPFECSAETMWKSLQKLTALPDDTLVYVGHDYTLDNYNFALSIEPDNKFVRRRVEELKSGKCPVPSTINQEKQTNLLLRADTAEVFDELRRRKDIWG